MIVYLGSCLASALIAYLWLQKNGRRSGTWSVVLFSALPMILTAALRYDVGQDYLHTYVPYFEMVQTGTLPANQQMEILYHGLNALIAWLGGDVFWVFAVCAVLFYLLVYAQIMRESPMPVLSIFLLTGMGYVFVFFNAMRQMVGCAFLLFSMRYVRKQRFWPFLLCVAAASGFHVSCALFLPVYFFHRVKIGPMAALLLTGAVTLLVGMISFTARSLIALTQYAVYLSSVFDTGETAYVMLAMNAALLLFYGLFYRKDRQHQTYFNIQLVAFWITIFSGKVVLILRLLWVFGLPSVISLPLALDSLPQEKDRKISAAVITLLYFIYMLYTVGIQNSNSVLPYQTVFSRWI